MHKRAHRNASDRQGVAWLDRRILTADDRRAFPDPLRTQDVATLTIQVLDQCQVSTAIRIVFDTLDNARNSVLVALEIDDAITLLVPAAVMTNRNPAVVIAAARFRLLVDQRAQGLALVQPVRTHCDDKSSSRGRRFGFM